MNDSLLLVFLPFPRVTEEFQGAASFGSHHCVEQVEGEERGEESRAEQSF